MDATLAAKQPAQRARSKIAANSRKTASRPSAKPVATNGNLALKEAPVPDDWEEF
jgi:hypothetical protein